MLILLEVLFRNRIQDLDLDSWSSLKSGGGGGGSKADSGFLR